MSIATRVHGSDRTASSGETTARSLAELRPGESGHVIGWNAELDTAAVRRFEDLGFAVGVDVQVLRRAPLGDPFVYGVAGYEIAIRREHTRHLLVDIR